MELAHSYLFLMDLSPVLLGQMARAQVVMAEMNLRQQDWDQIGLGQMGLAPMD